MKWQVVEFAWNISILDAVTLRIRGIQSEQLVGSLNGGRPSEETLVGM